MIPQLENRDVKYIDEDPEYVSGSESDFDDNPLENDDLYSETQRMTLFSPC